MSLYKKSLEVHYADFIAQTFGEDDVKLSKRLRKLGFAQTIAQAEQAEIYEKVLMPCLSDAHVHEPSKATELARAIGYKLKLVRKYLQIKEFYLFTIAIKRRELQLVYGVNASTKLRNAKYTKQLLLSDAHLRVLQQKAADNAKLAQLLGESVSLLVPTSLKQCLFHVMRMNEQPQALIVMRTEYDRDHYLYVEKPLGSLLDWAFLPELQQRWQPSQRAVKANVQLAKQSEQDQEQANALNLPQVLKQFTVNFLAPIEIADYDQGLNVLLRLLRLETFLVFEAQDEALLEALAEAAADETEKQAALPAEDTANDAAEEQTDEADTWYEEEYYDPDAETKAQYDETSEDEELEAEQEDSAPLPEPMFELKFAYGLKDEVLSAERCVPMSLLTKDEVPQLCYQIFKDQQMMKNKDAILLEVTPAKRILVLMSERDASHFDTLVAHEKVSAQDMFAGFLSGMLDFYYSRSSF